MTSKQAVLSALNHQEGGRVPVDFGGTAVTGMHVSCVAALRDYYALEKKPVKVHEPYQMLGMIEEDLQEVLGLDVEGVFPLNTMFGFPATGWKEWRMYDGLEVLVPEKFITTVDENGDTLIYPEGDTSVPPSGKMPEGGYFFDSIIRQEPIQEEKLDPEDNLEEFRPVSEKELAHFLAEARRAASTGRAVTATFGGTAFGDIALVPGPFIKHPKGIRDVTEWYISTLTRQNYIHAVFEKQCQLALANLEKIHAAVGDLVDVVFVCGTDFGTQNSLFCSPETFRTLYMPYYRQINCWIHENTNWKTFKHSCGAVEELMSHFIQAGFDIINPVQCSAASMEPEKLNANYGEDLVFWGGAVDTQNVLPFGTPEKVREQVLRRCKIFSRKGGFVFNSVHNIQAKTPVENIVSMIEAVKEFNGSK